MGSISRVSNLKVYITYAIRTLVMSFSAHKKGLTTTTLKRVSMEVVKSLKRRMKLKKPDSE